MPAKITLKSPVSGVDMTPVAFEGITLYRDPVTDGHWLPRGQLKVLAESQLEQELPPLLEIDESSMRHSGRVCPEDGFELVEYEFGGSGIKLDQCLSCRGVWLDQGELKKLMAYVYEHSDEMAEPADQEAEEGDHLSLRVRALSFLYQLTARPPYI